MIKVDGFTLRAQDVARIARSEGDFSIAADAVDRVATARFNFESLAERNIPIYGVTTGFGELIHNWVDKAYETELQENLIRSHSAGVGPRFSREEARAILIARLNALCRGHSAVRETIVRRLETYLRKGITPSIPEIGSLGASGDLAPLSAIALTVMGEGFVLGGNGSERRTADVLREEGLDPIQLKFKEGIALVNGTSAMTGIGCLVIERAWAQLRQAEIIMSLVLEGLTASTIPFDREGHDVAKPHDGQIDSAANLRTLLNGSQLTTTHKQLITEMMEQKGSELVSDTKVFIQKAYSLRCIPQILGAVRTTLSHAQTVVERELNSSNDNPLFIKNDYVFHGGNFHGQQVAFVMDFTAIATAQIGVLAERQLARLLDRGLNDGKLPEFLVGGVPGLSCGFAGAQYPATALVAENRTICVPASIQSVPSNGDNQDVVSMGLISTRNARRVLQNNNFILSVEALAAAQAIDALGVFEKLGEAGQATYKAIRSMAPSLKEDRYMTVDIERIAEFLSQGRLLDALTRTGIDLH